MQAIYQSLELLNNTAARQFELTIGDATAIITYKLEPPLLFLLHTEVPQQLEGKGAGTAIVEKTLHYIEQQQLQLVPLCAFVAAYLKRHPEWERVVAKKNKE